MWALTCPACESHLRTDPLWSGVSTGIPETPDEIALREANEKRTHTEQTARNAEVMEKLSALPEALRNLGPDMAQALIAALAAMNGAAAPTQAVSVDSEPETDPQPEPHDAVPAPTDDDLDVMTMPQLRELAASYGLAARRSRDDMVAMLKEYLAR